MIEQSTPENNVIDVVHETLNEKQTIELPAEYPFPWFRPKQGGVALRGKPEATEEDLDEDPDEVPVYDRDLWVKERSKDGEQEMALLALILPNDGLCEFSAPLSVLYKAESLRELLASKGVHAVANNRKLELLRQYISAWTKKLQDDGKAKIARTQFGWQDNDTCFVIGTREIDKDGEIHFCSVVHTINNIAKVYSKKGELKEWQRVANTYGSRGNEARAFSLFSSFGAPLYKFLNEGSLLLHLTNVASGVGKSTAQKIASSVWGNPAESLMTNSDTINAKLHRAGVLNNIPAFIDEITNMPPDKASDFAFDLNSGRGKNRMNSHVNSERKNETTWSTIFQSSGNNSFYDTLHQHKSSTEGEMYRVLEVPIAQDRRLSKREADELFAQILPKNYGIAGEVYMQYVVPNKDNVLARLNEVQVEFDEEFTVQGKERFYSAGFACAFVGAEIANKLGIIDIPIAPVRSWAMTLLKDTRSLIKKNNIISDGESFASVVSRFWNEHLPQILVVKAGTNAVDDVLLNQASLKPVIGALRGRYEVAPKKLYISVVDFEVWMAARRIPTSQVMSGLKASGILEEELQFSLGHSTALYETAPVMVYRFDAKKLQGPKALIDATEKKS
jgi:uncharacterized protein (DUF927 family)